MAIRKNEPVAAWSLVDAKTHLEEVIERAEDDGPQALERHRDDQGILLAPDSWDEDHPALKGTLLEFFERSPLRGLDLDLTRESDTVADWPDLDFLDELADRLASANDDNEGAPD